jgi:hypothetical protein
MNVEGNRLHSKDISRFEVSSNEIEIGLLQDRFGIGFPEGLEPATVTMSLKNKYRLVTEDPGCLPAVASFLGLAITESSAKAFYSAEYHACFLFEDRIDCRIHETVHAWIRTVNPDISDHRRSFYGDRGMPKFHKEKDIGKLFVQFAFEEGLAYWMTDETLEQSGEDTVARDFRRQVKLFGHDEGGEDAFAYSEAITSHYKHTRRMLDSLRAQNGKIMNLFEKSEKDNGEIVRSVFKMDTMVRESFSGEGGFSLALLGYHFAELTQRALRSHSIDDVNALEFVVKNPPAELQELILPSQYFDRLLGEHGVSE